MNKERKSVSTLVVVVIATAAFLPQMIVAGDLEPSAAPGPTMKTLDQIPPTWSQILPVAERFVVVMNDEAVLDKETGLVWEQHPGVEAGIKTWAEAIDYCINAEVGGRKGWHLPTVEQLMSLIDPSVDGAAAGGRSIPDGHPFSGVPIWAWSATTYLADSSQAYLAFLHGTPGRTTIMPKTSSGGNLQTWCVRGGQGYDGR